MEKTLAHTGQVADQSFKLAEQALAPIAGRLSIATDGFAKQAEYRFGLRPKSVARDTWPGGNPGPFALAALAAFADPSPHERHRRCNRSFPTGRAVHMRGAVTRRVGGWMVHRIAG